MPPMVLKSTLSIMGKIISTKYADRILIASWRTATCSARRSVRQRFANHNADHHAQKNPQGQVTLEKCESLAGGGQCLLWQPAWLTVAFAVATLAPGRGQSRVNRR